jgi:hypothetical protein
MQAARPGSAAFGRGSADAAGSKAFEVTLSDMDEAGEPVSSFPSCLRSLCTRLVGRKDSDPGHLFPVGDWNFEKGAEFPPSPQKAVRPSGRLAGSRD